jgi:lipoate-protein ligase A
MFALIDNFSRTEPHFNLALEEYAALHLSNEQGYCLFYANSPSVIVGKNQNVFEEINLSLAEQKKIDIKRRISGGGAVYHDEGNLNFSFLTPYNPKDIGNWKKFAEPVITALNKLGYPAELNYRNDIVLGEFKISGTAQYSGKNLMISHGTLLLDADLKALSGVLTQNSGKIISKSLKSHRSKVLNLNDFAKQNQLKVRSTNELRNELVELICGKNPEVIRFSDSQLHEIEKLAREKYCSYEWNIAYSPDFSCEKDFSFQNQTFRYRMRVLRGAKIESIFFEQENQFEHLFKRCEGVILKKNALSHALNDCESALKNALIESLLSFA